jgi:uncharacterized protein YggE
VLSIVEAGAVTQPPQPLYKMARAEMASQSVPTESGSEEVGYTVSVVFELR